MNGQSESLTGKSERVVKVIFGDSNYILADERD